MRIIFPKLIVLVFAASIGSATAQTVMDGSDEAVPAVEMDKLTKVLRSALVDPFSGQLIELRRVSTGICGKINSKNRAGGYGGFRLFAVNFQIGKLTIALPDIDLPDNPESLPTSQLKKIQSEVARRIEVLKDIQSTCSPKQ